MGRQQEAPRWGSEGPRRGAAGQRGQQGAAAMASLETEEEAGASFGGSCPTTDPPEPLPPGAAWRDPEDSPARRGRSSSEPPSLDGSDPPSPTEADPLDPFDRERLFDLLFRSQSRRLNEQRCALPRLRGAPCRHPARPWHSLPATPTGSPPEAQGLFCSLTSLQAEQFFQLVATAQARRLDDQRADFGGDPVAEEGGQGPPEPSDQGEELYSTILTHQSQRLEEQRSDPPIPLGAQELFDLLLRVQGGRMEEQRSDPPPALLPHRC
ncbi:G-protein-signaling modulator 3 [Emydura macquarii macquarii]|uniref:G-protein-signaling modulator 3 n=1 Tax=Emydura macquarii macquarii TaxID=1129001 RepID=UPI00352A0E9D